MAEQKDNRKVVIELQNVKRYFQVGSETVKALRGVSFKIYEGEFVTIMGTSGSANPHSSTNWAVLIHPRVENISLTVSVSARCRRSSALI